MTSLPDAVTSAARNHAVGTTRPGMPHRYAEERPALTEQVAGRSVVRVASAPR